ncbi:protein translocase subunit SecDF [Porphyromonas catoniae]|jgi:protein-export membrane protein, secD/secF family|uniref:Multifunctional fusion protein n=1 Tax=Porphyromonas catoniae ATCC 51270 TaxID=887901 RepID=Z4WW62_9PORP|nr:protein translocase subunit SecDF [Porphyromonas catoniae]EWC93052.1 export membrane protein SecD / protein-export membrane protein SecF multi-domain protein [Porphyromonas catoniae ATCC 51270]
MQNKGFVTFITASLALICAFYLSFSFITNHYDSKAEKMGDAAGKAYLDSMANEKVFLGYTLKEARRQQIGLGLDLKGGMNVILKLNAGDLVKNLANNSEDPNFKKAIDAASKSTSQSNYIDQFVTEYKRLVPNANLAVLFGAGDLRDQINPSTSEAKVIELLKEKYNSAVEASFNVLRTRIDRFGVVAPNLQRLEGQGRILVELPGVKDPERVRELLQRSANLQFWRTYKYEEIASDLQGLSARLLALSAPEAQPIPVPAENPLDDSLAVVEVQEPAPVAKAPVAVRDTLSNYLMLGGRGGATVGMARDKDRNRIDSLLAIAYEYQLLPEDLTLLWGAKAIQDPQTRKVTDLYELYAIRTNRSGKPDLSGDVVTTAKADVDNRGIGGVNPHVSMSMNPEGAQIWARLTKENEKRSIAIVLDGVVYSAPNVENEITGGQSSISGNFTIEEATDLANVLNSGKMETSIVIEQENVVGPTLGKASIQSGIISFAIALVLLMIYMCLAYGFVPGMIANLALVVNSFFTLGILASFNAVLTLSGIAGLVLTLGMAVDANVLINERIKEELRHGKGMTRAIADGYGNAFSAIFDSNLTTIITGVVLFYFGTGPIRGFATTLIIGLIASFITAVFLTRMVFEALDKHHKLDKVTYTTFMTKNLLVNPTYSFLSARIKGYALPLLIVVAGLVGYFTVGLNQGIEFSGGRNYIVKFDQQVDNQQLRDKLAPELGGKLVLTAIGTEGDQVRISTNYLIEDAGDDVEHQLVDKLYNGLSSFYKTQPTKEVFADQYIVSSQKVSASMSSDITRQALIAVGLSLLFMAIYILIRFRNVAFSIGAFASVTTTTLMIIAVYVLLWKVMPFTMEVDQNFIAALLAIIGYAINDVVIVFDRIREEIGNHPQGDRFEIVNGALNSTLSRTLNTSFTTFLVMAIVFMFGGASMRSFTFAILLGVIFGTYCTLFVATPIAYEVAKRRREKAATKPAK